MSTIPFGNSHKICNHTPASSSPSLPPPPKRTNYVWCYCYHLYSGGQTGSPRRVMMTQWQSGLTIPCAHAWGLIFWWVNSLPNPQTLWCLSKWPGIYMELGYINLGCRRPFPAAAAYAQVGNSVYRLNLALISFKWDIECLMESIFRKLLWWAFVGKINTIQ